MKSKQILSGIDFLIYWQELQNVQKLKEKSEFLFIQFQVSENSRELLPKSIILAFIIVAQYFSAIVLENNVTNM
jgi:hypothetical protein